MTYDKRISKQDRKQITKARKFSKTFEFRESEKHLNALKKGHVSIEGRVKTTV